MHRAALVLAMLSGACAPIELDLDPDPALPGLSLESIGPNLIVPGSDLVLTGRSFPSPGEGTPTLRLVGRFVQLGSASARGLDVRLRAQYESSRKLRVPATADLFTALGATDGRIEAEASLVVDSALDLRQYETPPQTVRIEVRRVLSPRLTAVRLYNDPTGSGHVHPNDWVEVRGEGLLLGGAEGRTVAVLSGCFLPEGESRDCSLYGVRVVNAEVPVRPVLSQDRTVGVFPYSPIIHGIRPGRFSGTVSLKNEQPSVSAPTRSAPRPLTVTQVKPRVDEFRPPAASMGQYVEIRGAGFIGGVGGPAGQATIIRLTGTYIPEGEMRMAPVDLEMVVEWVPRFPDGPIGRYVLDENDALGRALEAGGGLRRAAGRFIGTATPILRMGRDAVVGDPARVELRLLHIKQVVFVHFLPSYLDSLRLFGLRAVDLAVRRRVFDVARRDYAGVNIEFREEEPTDFALYSQVDIAGADPNGMGFLGYDNTPGRDVDNRRLYDRIGGVNAATQADGAPGYGGVFTEQFLGFSSHPGHVEKIASPESDSQLFDRIFDPLRADVGGRPAQIDEASRLPALSDGASCPAPPGDRPRQVACAVFVLGNLIGSTMTHEIGHSLGLANPRSMGGGFHNRGMVPGRLMNPGTLRSFAERAEVGQAPAVFCDTDYEYLRRILPGAATPPPPVMRPPCLD
ncbi:MAG: hypothetical protein RMK29_17455 [Myxococcales bacterium]|nr:hypothetical protein [Myxococcota bacterium]MDW8283498.1 hypothetical protein [Myxococcales bacterium]